MEIKDSSSILSTKSKSFNKSKFSSDGRAYTWSKLRFSNNRTKEAYKSIYEIILQDKYWVRPKTSADLSFISSKASQRQNKKTLSDFSFI